jgi:hypothetical protein
MRNALREPISRPVWQILLSWGMAVLVITGLLVLWIYSNQRQQDRDMCAMLGVLLAGPAPDAGDQYAVAARAAMEAYYENRGCTSP